MAENVNRAETEKPKLRGKLMERIVIQKCEGCQRRF
jgi:hypothetical protein